MLIYQILGFACVVCIAHARSPSKIISGDDVNVTSYPFIARLFHAGRTSSALICGGSIISTRYILTAAHCLEKYGAQDISIAVAYGSTYEKTYKVEKLIKYGGYDDGGYHDIGLLRTTEEILFELGHIEAVELTSKDYSDDGYPVDVVGYGTLCLVGHSPSSLQRLTTKIYDHEKCKAETTTVKDERWICTLEEAGKGFCLGDSGSPLLANGLQIGIAAHVDVLVRESPSVFTRIYHYLDWIREQLNNKNH